MFERRPQRAEVEMLVDALGANVLAIDEDSRVGIEAHVANAEATCAALITTGSVP